MEEHADINDDTIEITTDLESKLAALTGAEHFCVGLTPHYWAHVPMCIADVHQLGLVNGLNCIVLKDATHFIPVSKCTLVGIVVHVDRKSNGSTLYLIDDGTGLMDCLLWNKSDYYKLPPLVVQEEEDEPVFLVGDLVRVMGRLRIVSIQGVRRETTKCVWEIQDCVREVHVTIMEHVVAKHDNPRYYCSDPEYQHWSKCTEWNLKYTCTKKKKGVIQNGIDTLRLCGPKVAQDALEKLDFPSADDDVGAWRVFGTCCNCELSYKEHLLYCHCQATAEVLDPFFTFRDALLQKLLLMEEHATTEPLSFAYQTITQDIQLQEIAKTVCESVPHQRLFLKTFAALRKDGILHLVDRRADSYMLLSRPRVIEPHVQRKCAAGTKSELDYKLLQLERQSILRDVPNARIQHVKRCLDKARTLTNGVLNGEQSSTTTATTATISNTQP